MIKQEFPVLQMLASSRLLQVVLLLFSLGLYQPWALAIDLRPGEVRAPTPGVTFVQLRWQESERGAAYRDDVRLPGDPRVLASTRTIRLGQGFTIGENIAAAYVEIPQGERRAEGSVSRLGSDSGPGDITAAFAIWPYVDREARQYVGLAAYLQMPTGSYSSSRAINIGENRYRSALQLAAHAPLAGALEGMVAVDTLWSSDNNDAWPAHKTKSQSAIYNFQAGVLYPVISNLEIGVGYFFTLGGETRENGVRMDDALRVQRYQVSAQARLPVGLVVLQYGGDLETRNGYFEKHNLAVRYTIFF